MNEKPKSKLRWRLLRWGLIGLAVLATLAALLVTEENWRGKHAWEIYKRAAEARGDKIDLASVIPPTVPDDQNFFCAPIVAEALERLHSKKDDSSPLPDFRMDFLINRGDSELWPKHGANWQKGEMSDLKEWQTYFSNYNATPAGKTNGFPASAQPQSPAADVLAALSVFKPAVEELRQAAARPEARLPLDYENEFGTMDASLPWFAEQKRCAQLLYLRALAELQSEQPGSALSDIKLLLRLSDTTRNQPFLISHLVRIAMHAYALQPIYEGLAQHRWNDAQLVELEDTLAARDFLADFQIAMRGERMCGISTLETWRLTRDQTMVGEGEIVTNSMRWIPSVFFYRNELAVAQISDQFILPLVDDQRQTVSLDVYRSGQKFYHEQTNHYSPYKVLALMSFQSISKAVERFALIQSQVDMARVACALERYRLAHGGYPETLDALAPQFIEKLPHDLINGQPLHYRQTADGKFILYSVGWNETDDGGTIEFTKSGRVDAEKGDWVWKY